MAWRSLAFAALVIIWSRWYGPCLSCDVVDLFKRVDGPPLYIQQRAPTTVTGQLGLCSLWCAALETCLAFFWGPGLCAQVNPGVVGNVAAMVFMVKKNVTLPEPDYSFPMEEVIGGELSGSIPGAVIGDAKLIRGVRSQALYVNGLDQRVDLGDQRHNCMGDLNKCNRGFVMAMWLRIHRYDGPGGLNDAYYISNGGHTSKSMGVALLMREQRLLVMFRTENRLWKVYYENDVSLHAWYHVVLTWSITSGGNVYINGALAGHNQGGQSGFYNREGNTFINFVLGDNNQNPPQQPGEMTLDELRIWDIITDDQWIWELYAADALP